MTFGVDRCRPARAPAVCCCQLVDRLLAAARHRLVGRDVDALDLRGVVQRLQRHQHLHGRAVRVGDDVVLAVAGDRVRIHLGHHQRNVVLVTELRGVIDHDAAGLGGAHRVHLGNAGAGREQADLRLARNRTSPGPAPAASRPWKRTVRPTERALASGIESRRPESPLLQDRQHVAADEAGRADHRHIPTSAHRFPRSRHPFSAGRTLHETPRADKVRTLAKRP